MKHFLLLFLAVIIISCATDDNRQATTIANTGMGAGYNTEANVIQDFANVIGKEWVLIRVYVDGEDIQFRRENNLDTFPELYTITFNEERLTGTGAPNRYNAPYTLSENNSISIMQMISTMMASIFEAENLREHEYYAYLNNVHSWRLTSGDLNLLQTLELYSQLESGQEVQLIYTIIE